MSALGQKTLVSLLTERDALEVLVREGLDLDCVPTEPLRGVVRWSLDYFHQSGRTKAPSAAVLHAEFGDLLADHEIDFDNVEESIEWAIDALKGTFAHKQVSQFNKDLASAMAEAGTADKVEVTASFASRLVALSMRLESQENVADARVAMRGRLDAYEARAASGETLRGMAFNMPLIDSFTGGIRPGELAVCAAGAKTGKSYFVDYVAMEEHRRGRAVALFTLENDIDMTMDRIACLACGIDPRRWDRGEATPEEVAAVRLWIEDLEQSPVPLWVLQPEPGAETVEHMVRDAQVRGAESLIIDQLTFIKPPDESAPRYIQIRDITHTLKNLIKHGRQKMPCLLAHQISREGIKSADKVGHLEMYHLAEGSEVERTADWVFGLYRSKADVGADLAKFQTLACRRAQNTHFELGWDLRRGAIAAHTEIELAA